MLWKIIGHSTKPAPNNCNRKKAWLAFQGMWVAGTLGVFFVALISNLPEHLSQIKWPEDFKSTKYTFQVFLSYGYLLWLLSYFFISNLKNEILKKAGVKDLIFDVIQSAVAFYAIYKLGFITLKLNLDFLSFAYANLSIFIICLFSLIMFGCKSKKDINLLRLYGAVISIVSFFTAKYFFTENFGDTLCPYIILTISFLLLWVVLWLFIAVSVDDPQ